MLLCVFCTFIEKYRGKCTNDFKCEGITESILKITYFTFQTDSNVKTVHNYGQES